MTEQAWETLCFPGLPGTPVEGAYIFRDRNTTFKQSRGRGLWKRQMFRHRTRSRSTLPVIDCHVSCFPHFMQLHCCSFWNIGLVKLFITLQQWERSFVKCRRIEPEPPSAPSSWTANGESPSSQSYCLSQCSSPSGLYWPWRTAWDTWLHCPPHLGTRNT